MLFPIHDVVYRDLLFLMNRILGLSAIYKNYCLIVYQVMSGAVKTELYKLWCIELDGSMLPKQNMELINLELSSSGMF